MFCLHFIVAFFAIPGTVLSHRTAHRQDACASLNPKALLDQAIIGLGGSRRIAALQDVTYVGQT